MSSSQKYVYCRPCGGFNDNLNQLQKAINYCQKYSRTLIIAPVWGYKFNWEACLSLLPREELAFSYLGLTEELFNSLKNTKCLPACLTGLWDNFELERLNNSWVCKGTDIPATFDFNKDYTEDILIHSQPGGGCQSFLAVKNFKVRDILRDRVGLFRKDHPNYIAAHIRNTDYVTDYKDFLAAIKTEHSSEEILLCSDDWECIQYAKELFGFRLISITAVPLIRKGRGIHHSNNWEYGELEYATLLDLICLGYSTKFYKCPVSGIYTDSEKFNSMNIVRYSGFSLLAEYLHKNREVLDAFADQPTK